MFELSGGSKYQWYLYMKVLRLVQGEAISVRVRKCSSYREVLSIKGICIWKYYAWFKGKQYQFDLGNVRVRVRSIERLLYSRDENKWHIWMGVEG